MSDYHINIFASKEDGGDIADIPDLAHCSAFGATPEEALTQALIAQATWIDAAAALGKPIPKPKYRPAIDQMA
jgi:predicted RNase H-like HicB family nuclease